MGEENKAPANLKKRLAGMYPGTQYALPVRASRIVVKRGERINTQEKNKELQRATGKEWPRPCLLTQTISKRYLI
jgi:hypothetical protein